MLILEPPYPLNLSIQSMAVYQQFFCTVFGFQTLWVYWWSDLFYKYWYISKLAYWHALMTTTKAFRLYCLTLSTVVSETEMSCCALPHIFNLATVSSLLSPVNMQRKRQKLKIYKFISLWIANWSHGVLPPFSLFKESSRITVTIQSHCETVFDQPESDGDGSFCRKMYFFRETTVESVEWPSLKTTREKRAFVVSLSVRQITVNEMRKNKTFRCTLQIWQSKTRANVSIIAPPQPLTSLKQCAQVYRYGTKNKLWIIQSWFKIEEQSSTILNQQLASRSDSV